MLNLKNVTVGQRLRLRNGSVGEVVENLGDGIWVQLRFMVTVPGTPAVGDEELVHCEELAGFADANGAIYDCGHPKKGSTADE